MTSVDEALASWGSYNLDDPFPVFAEVRARGPVHRVTLPDGHEAWLVVDHDTARDALNDQRLSKDMHAALAASDETVAEGLPGPDFARHMLVVDPPDHTRLRRLASAAFSVRRIESLRPHVQAIVDELLGALEAEGPQARVDLVSGFSFPLPFTVICELLGVPDERRQPLGTGLTTLLAPTTTDDEYARAKAASNAVVAMLQDLVDAKQRDPGDDLVSALVAARDGEERLNQQELLSTIFQLIVAGHDTTSSLIGNSVVALLRNPTQLAALQANPDAMPAAIEELLRYDAPVPHATYPAKFATPERLQLERDEDRHLAFGHGIHFCLGAALARMEGQIALGPLLTRFPDTELAVTDAELHWAHGDGLVLRGLPVVLGEPANHHV